MYLMADNRRMAKGPSDYETGTERALFRLSKGVCYYPECEVPIMSLVNGHAIIGVQIAHIRGANPKSARYDGTMTDDERRAFSNLMLMCVTHHNLIDRLEPEKHSVELLTQWKADNEVEDGFDSLAPRLTEGALISILEEFAQTHQPLREISVSVLGGLVTHSDGVTAGRLESIPAVLDLNPHLRKMDRVLVADINNTGTLPVVVDAIDFRIRVGISGREQEEDVPFLGRNDYPGSNPPLPMRLQDGGSLQWFIMLESLLLLEASGAMKIKAVSALVRLGSGERIESTIVDWPRDLSTRS